jgi:hypothetical protein
MVEMVAKASISGRGHWGVFKNDTSSVCGMTYHLLAMHKVITQFRMFL